MPEFTADIASIACPTEAEGPGRRWAAWFQGCSIRCPGCCNPHLFSTTGGTKRSVSSLKLEIEKALEDDAIEGITLLGGEPTEQSEAATALASHAVGLGLTVLLFSGRTIHELLADPRQRCLLSATDILVDGPFDQSKPETHRRWIGSTNQGLHFLSNRVCHDDPRWEMANTLEIRLQNGKLTVNGFPIPGKRFPI